MPITGDLYKRIINAKRFIDECFHEPIGLEEISRQAYLSPFHFHRLFTRIYRRTPHRYLTLKRLDKAIELLKKDTHTIVEVCNEVGFESHGSFSTLFKKETGFPPQYYRNMAWLKEQQEKEQPKVSIPHCFISCYTADNK